MAFFVPESVMTSRNHKPETISSLSVTRRDCLRYFICSWGFMLTMPLSTTGSAEVGSGPSLLKKYLGEELSYQIGYWLIDHCGEAQTGFLRTDVSGIYKISLEGHGIGFIDFLLGGVKYSYTSFCRYFSNQDRLGPVYFELKKQRGAKVSVRSIGYHYPAGEIIFQQTNAAGDTRMQKESLRTDRIYEDYLTLFYNFRHGCYGPLKKDHTYRMPLYTKKQMHPVMLHTAGLKTENRLRRREHNKKDKDFFVRFQINPEDVSSGSGEILGWLSSDATPLKGIIQDVVFFGDLWGDLVERQFVAPGQGVRVPDIVKNML